MICLASLHYKLCMYIYILILFLFISCLFCGQPNSCVPLNVLLALLIVYTLYQFQSKYEIQYITINYMHVIWNETWMIILCVASYFVSVSSFVYCLWSHLVCIQRIMFSHLIPKWIELFDYIVELLILS